MEAFTNFTFDRRFDRKYTVHADEAAPLSHLARSILCLFSYFLHRLSLGHILFQMVLPEICFQLLSNSTIKWRAKGLIIIFKRKTVQNEVKNIMFK